MATVHAPARRAHRGAHRLPATDAHRVAAPEGGAAARLRSAGPPRPARPARSLPVRAVLLLVHALAWVLLLGSAAALTAAVLVPRVGGAVPYTVLTGSMSPAIEPGALVVVRPVAPEDVAVGDVITYQLRSGEPTVVTHRVVGVSYAADGTRSFTTRGDANTVDDADPVRDVQVRGELWYAVPHLGRLGPLLTTAQREHLVVTLASSLFAYAAAMVLLDQRDRRRARRGATVRPTGVHRG